MPTPWFPRNPAIPGPLPAGAASEDTLQKIEQSTDAVEQILASPLPAPVGIATEVTQQQVLGILGNDVGGTAPIAASTGIAGLLRAQLELFWAMQSIVSPGSPALKVDVVQTVGGGGGGDASAANQVTEIARLDSIITALATALDINLPTGASTEAKQDAMITLLNALGILLSGTLAVNVGNFPSSQAVTGTFWQGTQPVSAATLPLPAGAATGAKQDAHIALLQSSTCSGTVIFASGTALTSNPARKGWGIQNLSTEALYVRRGSGASATVFDRILPGGAVTEDGRGDRMDDTMYTGIITVYAATTVHCVVSELT